MRKERALAQALASGLFRPIAAVAVVPGTPKNSEEAAVG